MNIHDYLISSDGINWRALLECWRPPLPGEFSVWFVNRFGDAFIVTADGVVHRLDVGGGTFAPLAGSREEFARRLDQADNLAAWLRPTLVDECRRAGLQLARGECYGFKVPPALLGKYEVANLTPTRLDSHYSWLAHLARQDQVYWTED